MTASIVTNISDLTPAMRAGLHNWNTAPPATRRALIARGLVRDFGWELTDAGRRALDRIIAEESNVSTSSEAADLYDAVCRTSPALTDLARCIAQLRRWAAEPAANEWERGRVFALAMVADQLKRDALGSMAPLLMPEAIRRDAEHYGATPDTQRG